MNQQLNQAPNQPMSQPQNQQPNQSQNQPPVFIKESKQINNDLEKANHQISKMLLLHFVNPGNQMNPTNQMASQEAPATPEQQPRSFSLVQPEQLERQPANSNKMEETAPRMVQGRPLKEPAKNEEETSTSANDQANREELYERPDPNPNAEHDEPEPASLAQFAQVIRHVIDQQQQNQEAAQQAPVMQQAPAMQQAARPAPSSAISSQTQPASMTGFPQFPPRKAELPIENSNKETEKAQESIQTPAFMLVSDDEN